MNLITCLATFAIVFSVANFAEAINNENICNQDSCYSCIDHTCTKFCTGVECGKCLQGIENCCQAGDCNLCYGQRCCSNTTCNQCIASCFNGCSTELTCYSTCFNKCSPPEVQNGTASKVFHNLNRNVPFNVTTTINITNTVNNTNYIDAIVYANRTNNNTINLKDALADYFNQSSFNNSTGKKYTHCCNVSHPLNCHYVGLNKICLARKHVECSPICKSRHMLIGPGDGTLRVISLMAPPYMYYGNYEIIDCEKCYTCDESNRVSVCSGKRSCPKKCKAHIQRLHRKTNSQYPPAQQNVNPIFRNLETNRPLQVVSKEYPPNQNVVVLPASGIQSTPTGMQDTNPAVVALSPQQYYPNHGMVQSAYPYQSGYIANGYYPSYTNAQGYQDISQQSQYVYPYSTYQGGQYHYPDSYSSSGSQVPSNVPVVYSTYPVQQMGQQNQQYQQNNNGYLMY